MPADGMGAATKSNQGGFRHSPLTARARQNYTLHRASAIAMSVLGHSRLGRASSKSGHVRSALKAEENSERL
jgi:hypothetical protein